MNDRKSNILIVYYSSTGFTKKYVDWLQLRLHAEVCRIENFAREDISGYKVIIFGSCLRAGKIKDLGKFIRIAKKADCAKLIFFTGSMDYEDMEKSGVFLKNAKAAHMLPDNLFYCPGGLDFEKMKPMHKSMVEFYLNMLKKKHGDELSEEQRRRLDNISFDATNNRYIEPIVAAALRITGDIP